ncbi:MAG: PP2C family protein-serine/threonine phosphatase [Planctomycetota bacterium]
MVYRGLPTLEDPYRSLEDDLDLARRIHRSLMPKRLERSGVEIDSHCRAMRMLGGDYATVHERAPGHVFLCACDVTGHGLAAALLATRINGFVRHALESVDHPCQVVESLNRFIVEHFGGLTIYATFFCLELDFERAEIPYAGCAHPPPVLWRARESRCVRLQSRHTMVGLFPELPEGCHIDHIPFAPGDRLLLYTDGVIETRDHKGEMFGIERLEKLLSNLDAEADTRQWLGRLFSRLDDFRHGVPHDDALVVAVKFL